MIAVGNALRGDDAAGLEIGRRLSPADGIRVIEQDGEVAAIVEALRAARAAVIVDAAAGPRPGRLARFDAASHPLPARLLACSTHAPGVAEAIELARALGVLPRTCVVYAIEGASFDVGAPMSAAVEGALAAAVARIQAEIEALGDAAPEQPASIGS